MQPVLARTVRAARSRAAPLALVLAAAACGKDITVHLRTGDRPPGDTPAAVAASSSAQLVAGIAIERVQIVLRDLRMQENPTADGSAASGDWAVGPAALLVDLTGGQLAPGAMTEIVPRRSLKWSSYYQTVLDLRPVTAEEAAADPALLPLVGSSLVITGRLPGGAPFTFQSSVAVVIVRSNVFRAGLNHNNLTVNVALNRWFQGPAGEPLDPADPTVHATIEANIVDSIDAYMDDNVDGLPDRLG